MTTYEVTPAGRVDPVPGTETPDDPDVMAPGGLISLEDMRAPWSGLDWSEADR